jgi:hypothetical protein
MKAKKIFAMMTAVAFLALLVASGVGAFPPKGPNAQGGSPTVVSYQGRVMVGGSPYSGTGYFKFAIVDSPCTTFYWSNDGEGDCNTQPTDAVQLSVSEGLFNVLLGDTTLSGMTQALDASVFSGTDRYLRVWFSTSAGGPFTQLGDQRISSVPFALQAEEAKNADMLDGYSGAYYQDWNNLTNVPAGFADGVDDVGAGAADVRAGDGLTRTISGSVVTLTVQFAGTGSATTVARSDHNHDAAYWSLTGNSGTTPGTNFLGTTDNVALQLHVNGTRALRIEPNAESPNMIGGYSGNSVTSGVKGATIGGGGKSGATNRVTDDYGTVGGGEGNRAGSDDDDTTNATYATVGGGVYNNASDSFATVGGGVYNNASGYEATVGGGAANNASGYAATVGGGRYNDATASFATIAGGGPSDPKNPTTTNNVVYDDYGTIGGGGGNRAGSDDDDTTSATYATVGGGYSNEASGQYATIGGGYNITVTEDYATVGGGYKNTASGFAATVGGGSSNEAIVDKATVGGGEFNEASGGWATVGGGHYNDATQTYATVGGGGGNNASGWAATVGGGASNEATEDYATVGGGRLNKANASYATIAGGGPTDPEDPGDTNNWVYDNYGTIGGGGGNRAGSDDDDTTNATYATVGGGYSNEASGQYATIGGGYNITVTADYATVGGGQSNEASGYAATVGGGRDNTASEKYDTVGGGYSNEASGSSATVGGGANNEATASFATVPGGFYAKASHYGQMAYASGQFKTPGDAQTSVYVMRKKTTSTGTWEDLYLDGLSALLTIESGRTLTFDILVVGRSDAGESAGYQIYGVIENFGGTTSLIASTVTTIGEDDANWNAQVSADDTNDALLVQVMGAGENIRWVAVVRTAEVSW